MTGLEAALVDGQPSLRTLDKWRQGPPEWLTIGKRGKIRGCTRPRLARSADFGCNGRR
jgi:hypothetical protein